VVFDSWIVVASIKLARGFRFREGAGVFRVGLLWCNFVFLNVVYTRMI